MTFNLQTKQTDRRRFLKNLASVGALTVTGSVAGSVFRRPMTAMAVAGGVNDTVIVSVFLRGASDSLNMICPHGDPWYYTNRWDAANSNQYGLEAGEYTDLDGFFGLHNSLAPVLPLWNEGKMSFVHAAGSPDPTRSHFMAMPNMWTGLSLGGWMGRAIQAGGFDPNSSGLSIGTRTNPQLAGPYAGQVIDTVQGAITDGMNLEVIRPSLEAMYAVGVANPLESNAVLGALASIDDLAAVNPETGDFPSSALGQDLAEAAVMINADIGVRAVAIDAVGWDHHSNGVDLMISRCDYLSTAIAAFFAELEPAAAKRVIMLVSTEFGRTARVNGSNGTDHGRGSAMWVIGDPLVQQGGGQVLTPGGWPSLENAGLPNNFNALQITTDFRDVYSEIAMRHLRVDDNNILFPGYAAQEVGVFDPIGDVDRDGDVDGADVDELLFRNTVPNLFHRTSAGDLDHDGNVDLKDALMLGQTVGGN